MTDTVRDFFVKGQQLHGTPDQIEDLLRLLLNIEDVSIGVVSANAPKKKQTEE